MGILPMRPKHGQDARATLARNEQNQYATRTVADPLKGSMRIDSLAGW